MGSWGYKLWSRQCNNTVLLASTYREVEVGGEVNVRAVGFNVVEVGILCEAAGVGIVCVEVGSTVLLDDCLLVFGSSIVA